MRAAPCTVYRPDASGTLAPVAVVAGTAKRPSVIRSGPFVAWDDQCQATRAGDTLAACAEYICAGETDAVIVRMGPNGPQPLNAAERAELHRLIEEGSE